MKYIIYSLSLIFFISCSETENRIDKKNCDFEICEEGRSNIDTLINEHGKLIKENDQYFIEVTQSDPEPKKLYISCFENQSILPETGNYVKFSAYIKDPCAEESSIDSLSISKIELVNPLIQESCGQNFLQEGFDIQKNDDKLSIHHLTVLDDCLHVLVSYTGSCDQIPNLTLHNSGDILFGGVQIVVSVQGPINDDCNQVNYALLKYDLSPIWDILENYTSDEVTLYFLSQGLLRIGYSKI